VDPKNPVQKEESKTTCLWGEGWRPPPYSEMAQSLHIPHPKFSYSLPPKGKKGTIAHPSQKERGKILFLSESLPILGKEKGAQPLRRGGKKHIMEKGGGLSSTLCLVLPPQEREPMVWKKRRG